jgi:serine/threonine-protein kinase
VAKSGTDSGLNPIAPQPEVTQVKDAHPFRARAQWKKGDFEEALKDCDGAIRLNPEDSSFYETRAAIHYHRNDFFQMESDYTEIIRLVPKNAQAYAARGLARFFQNEPFHAIADCTDALRIDPMLPEARLYRAYSHLRLKNYQEALGDIVILAWRGQLKIGMKFEQTCARDRAE